MFTLECWPTKHWQYQASIAEYDLHLKHLGEEGNNIIHNWEYDSHNYSYNV